MVKISWVKIPAGEYPTGLSQAQIEYFGQKARAEAGYFNWSGKEQQQFEDYVADKREQWQLMQMGKDGNPFTPLPLEIVQLKQKYAGVDNLLDVERVLAPRFAPAYTAKMKTFYIARFPITVEQCDEFFNHFDDERLRKRREVRLHTGNYPEEVEWHIADLFCQWAGGRLPTSVEWECAARGPEGLLYPWGNEWDPSRLNLLRSKSPVDAYPEGVSPFKVWDMIGNRAEWTLDLTPDPINGGMAAKYRGVIVKEQIDPEPDWFAFNASFGASRAIDAPPFYVGFRPMLDSWRKRLWSGFNHA